MSLDAKWKCRDWTARGALLALALQFMASCGDGHFGSGGSPFGRSPDGSVTPHDSGMPPPPPPMPRPDASPPVDAPTPPPPPPPMPMPDTGIPDVTVEVTPPPPPPPPADAGAPDVATPRDAGAPDVAPPPPPPIDAGPPPRPTDIPANVDAILRSRCIQCHTFGQRDPIGWGYALDINRLIAADIVVPGDLAKSRMWQRVAVKADMPFDNSPRIQGADLLAIKNWIETLQRPTPQPRSQEQILDIIVLDQNGAANRNPNVRYLSFAHFVDEHRSVAEMTAIEGVLNLTLNSLSRSATLYKAEAVNYERSIFRIDLGKLGWNADLWNEVVSFYPYCIQSAKQAHRDVYNRLGTEAPVIRGDWFMATAHKAPLYEDLADIKATLDEQAAVLGVDINANLQNAQNVIRMGFRSSGVSQHNRVIERHARGNGAYLWVSYDFAQDGIGDTNDILENPLGPRLRDRDNFAHDFVNAAGEVIFSLPNGMQAFMLVNDVGQRIEIANTAIVADPRRRDGAVQNGISCFGCHGITGMLRPRVFDEVIKNAELNQNKYSAQELDRIRKLYVRNGDAILATDATRYFKSVDALGANRTLGGGIEYDTYIALIGEYEAKLGLRGSALEIGIDAGTLATTVKNRPELFVPVSAADPLVLRDDFVCRYRRIVQTLKPVTFCANTFSDASLQTFCDNR